MYWMITGDNMEKCIIIVQNVADQIYFSSVGLLRSLFVEAY